MLHHINLFNIRDNTVTHVPLHDNFSGLEVFFLSSEGNFQIDSAKYLYHSKECDSTLDHQESSAEIFQPKPN
ncbi:hypothetical protein Glove_152g94 [Diversispora epigaea]|uniref:Uncharacterized protein n=1 Tax=Diversispora epigaea TaxID=1348612 RepID=A0A397IVH1_9GLOM|nr:hypothetical protein Glove_152g94 [Diversispora epigaea]